VDALSLSSVTQEYVPIVKQWIGLVSLNELQTPVSLFWSILVSGVTLWTVFTTYGLGGAAMHGKNGWKFVQPGVGGLRFIIVQIMTWMTATLSISMPWVNLKNIGWLSSFGVIADDELDPASHRGLLVVGSALGMLSNTFCVLGLMSFNPKEKVPKAKIDKANIDKARRRFEFGKWKWNIFGDSEAWWWLFLILQGTLVIFSWQLAVMIEMNKTMKNNIVQSLLLMVATSLLAVPLALTNAVAGKWRHGERKYRLTMPFQGGAMFVTLQALGWALFASASLGSLMKLYSTATASTAKFSISTTAALGLVSYLCIVASLFWFDPAQVEDETKSEDSESDSEVEDASSRKQSQPQQGPYILGKRSSPSKRGSTEYLVQWKATSTAIWMLKETLLQQAPRALIKNKKNLTNRHRSKSPSFTRRSHGLNDDESESSDEDNDEGEEEEEIILPEKSPASPPMITKYSEEETDTDVDNDVWEEVEDEHGNVYYFNEKKKIAQTIIPAKLEKALEMSA